MSEDNDIPRKRFSLMELSAQRQGITIDELNARKKKEKREKAKQEQGCVIRALESALSKIEGQPIQATDEEWDIRIEQLETETTTGQDLHDIEQAFQQFKQNDSPLGRALKKCDWRRDSMDLTEITSAMNKGSEICVTFRIDATNNQGEQISEYHLAHLGQTEEDGLVSISDKNIPLTLVGGKGAVFVFNKNNNE